MILIPLRNWITSIVFLTGLSGLPYVIPDSQPTITCSHGSWLVCRGLSLDINHRSPWWWLKAAAAAAADTRGSFCGNNMGISGGNTVVTTESCLCDVSLLTQSENVALFHLICFSNLSKKKDATHYLTNQLPLIPPPLQCGVLPLIIPPRTHPLHTQLVPACYFRTQRHTVADSVQYRPTCVIHSTVKLCYTGKKQLKNVWNNQKLV